MRARLVATLIAVVAGLQLLPAATVSYDIVYVRGPRNGDATNMRWPEVFHPLYIERGSDLMLLHPDGREETLVAAGKGAVTDPCVSFDAKWVYYSYFSDPFDLSQAAHFTPLQGSDIYKINLQTRQVVRLTHQEYTPNTSVRTSPLPYGIFNTGACPVSGGKVVFTSNRNGFIPTKGYTSVTMQLFVMDENGSNVTPIAPMTLGSALHPFQLQDGRIAFSSFETQGIRDSRVWGLWGIWPDGRAWEPLMSALTGANAFHFATQLSGGDIVIEDYYNLNNDGFGSFYRFPSKSPDAPVGFHSAFPAENPPMAYTPSVAMRQQAWFGFSPRGLQSITPFTHPLDQAAAPGPDGVTRVGKVTHPSGAPNGDLLLVWSPGPVNLLPRPVTQPVVDAGLYLAKNSGPVERASDLVLIKNDPRYNEQWPRAVVPYQEIYGSPEPRDLPWLPNDGTLHPTLPPGTPYGIVGTSSLYKRESFPGRSTPNANYDGLDPFNWFSEFGNSNWFWQGADAGKFDNSEIATVRIVMMEPTSEGARKWFTHANERLRILGEIPVRKTGGNGAPVLDPEGNPDTSFWARVPADTPFTFQLLDQQGRLLTMAQTWHQVRPGEIRTNCGGCHAHSQQPLSFDQTAARLQLPVDLTLQPAHDVEFVRDIRPILQRSCVSCHRGSSPPADLAFDVQTLTPGVYPDAPELSTPQDYAVIARNAGAKWGYKPIRGTQYEYLNASRYIRKFQSRRSLLAWKIFGARLDGWTNASWPTERTPGDRATFPAGASLELADLDYSDSANHAAMLSAAEKRLIAAWIDLGTPVDLGGGYWEDENRPTLTLTMTADTLLVGATDAYSGLDAASLSLSIDGKSTSLVSIGDGRWSAPLPGAVKTIEARVKDRAGNWTTQALNLAPASSAAASRPKPPRSPSNVRIVR